MHAPSRSIVRGITILELLIATVVLLLLVGLLVSVNNHTMQLYRRTSGQVDAFQSARLAFDVMIRQLNQATLNVYWDYDDAVAPTRYLRKSDLAFVTGPASTLLGSGAPADLAKWPGKAVFFQAPLGRLDNVSTRQLNLVLNTCGFYVEYGDANAGSPMPRPKRSRYRLMQMQTSGEKMTEFGSAVTKPAGNNWFTSYLPESRILAEDIVLLVIRPLNQNRVDLANLGYTLDTRVDTNTAPQPATANQLPPLVSITLVAVSEESVNQKDPTNGYLLPGSALSLFSDPTDYEADISSFQGELKQAKLDYRLFTQQVALPNSKWSD